MQYRQVQSLDRFFFFHHHHLYLCCVDLLAILSKLFCMLLTNFHYSAFCPSSSSSCYNQVIWELQHNFFYRSVPVLQCWSVRHEEGKRSYPHWALGLLLCVFVQDHCKVGGLSAMDGTDFQKHLCASKSLGASVSSCNFGGVCQPTTGDVVLWFTTEYAFLRKRWWSLFFFSQ